MLGRKWFVFVFVCVSVLAVPLCGMEQAGSEQSDDEVSSSFMLGENPQGTSNSPEVGTQSFSSGEENRGFSVTGNQGNGEEWTFGRRIEESALLATWSALFMMLFDLDLKGVAVIMALYYLIPDPD